MRSEAIETTQPDTQRETPSSDHAAPLTIRVKLDLSGSRRGRKKKGVSSGQPIPGPQDPVPRPRASPLSRTLSQALVFERMIHQGHLDDHADLGRIRGLSRGRISQIMALLSLAPDIQGEILELPGDCSISEHAVRPICRTLDWGDQRVLWRRLYHPTSTP